MSMQVHTCAERPDLWERAYDQITGVWPRYNEQGDVLGQHWSRLDEDFRDYQFVLYDDERELALAHGHSIPIAWDGTVEGLPAGIDGAIDGAVALFEEGGEPNALSALAIEIPPEHQGGGHSRTMIGAMRDIAAGHGFANLIAPLRPTWKERYPLTPIERYARWTREDGLPFDPWIRLHVRLGAEILAARAALAPHHRHGGRVGGVDGDAVPGERHVRLPALPRPARGRPRRRSRLLLGAERVGPPSRNVSGMRVLSIVHQTDAAAGVFADEVLARGHSLDDWLISEEPAPPAPLETYDAVLVFGGAMHVDQEDRHGWLRDERLLLQRLAEEKVPLMGVCLGGQLVAKALHAHVRRLPSPEIGWPAVQLTGEASSDPVFAGLPGRFPAFQWHLYHFELPAGAVPLARNERCLQAFRAGPSTWAIQFHAEVTRESVEDWLRSSDPRRTAPSTSRRFSPRRTSASTRGTPSAGSSVAGSWSSPTLRGRLAARPLVPRALVVDRVDARRPQQRGRQLRALSGVAVRDDAPALGDPALGEIPPHRGLIAARRVELVQVEVGGTRDVALDRVARVAGEALELVG